MGKVKKFGEKVLRMKARKVAGIDEEISRLVRRMKTVLNREEGLGLAAPQIGVSKRIFIALDRENKKIITAINPELTCLDGKEIDFEGCLSFPEIFFSIERARKVILKGIDEKGESFAMEADGILARCFQHEMDHLDGKLIIDYATEQEKANSREKLERLAKR